MMVCVAALALLLLLAFPAGVEPLDNGLALKPPMGYNVRAQTLDSFPAFKVEIPCEDICDHCRPHRYISPSGTRTLSLMKAAVLLCLSVQVLLTRAAS